MKMPEVLKRTVGLFIPVLIFTLSVGACGGQAGLKVGDRAPEFRLPEARGGEVALTEVIDQRPALLYFHMALG